MADLSKVNMPAIEIMMRMTGMWGLHMFKYLERAMSGWHSSETAEPVKKCINRMLENQQNDFTAQKLFQICSPGNIIDILQKIFIGVTANKRKNKSCNQQSKAIFR